MKLTIDLTDREYKTLMDSLIEYAIKFPNKEHLSKKVWSKLYKAELKQKKSD